MESFNIYQIDDALGINVFYFKLIFGFITAFFLTYIAIPKIIRVSYRKNLMDEPIKRSSHIKKVPNLGGLAIFFAVSIAASVFSYELFGRFIFLFASMVILMFTGLMDDILVVAPDKKLYAQILTATMLVLGSDIRISNFFGVLGIYQLNYFISIGFTIFFFIIFINSFNLIDGIDGLAGGITIAVCLAFAYSFYALNDLQMVVFAFTIIGSILAFLYFNLSKKFKIFMGDTGSLLLGFLIAFMTIKFLHLVLEEKPYLPTAPAIAVAILIIPIIDTLSVTFIRLKNGHSPMKADKNHLHHKFLSVGLSHQQTALILIIVNILVLIVTYFTKSFFNVNIMIPFVLFLGFLFIYLPYYFLKHRFVNNDEKNISLAATHFKKRIKRGKKRS